MDAVCEAQEAWSPRLRAMGAELREAREREREVTGRARKTALDALAGGESEHSVARDLGVDRMTVRKWQRKR